VEDHYSKFRINDALMAVYGLFWDDYCSWYLELVKPAYGEAIDGMTFEATVGFFDKLLKLIHPVMPFITEEIWHAMADRRSGETIMFERTPVAGPYDTAFLDCFDQARQIIVGVRGVRAQKNIPPKEPVKLCIEGKLPEELLSVIRKAGGVSDFVNSVDGACTGFIVGTIKCSVPLDGFVDTEAEKAKVMAELEHQRKFLAGVRAKLGNENFIAHAPQAVVDVERKKESDALARIEALEASLKSLN
jgi:valyl-tRNA synthetase